MIIKTIKTAVLILFAAGFLNVRDIAAEVKDNPGDAAAGVKFVLPETESLKFNVYWKFIKVGSGTLDIKGFEEINGKKAYHLSSTASSIILIDNFYMVRDENDAWLDAETLSSLKYYANISEGSWKKYETVWFNYDDNKFVADIDGVSYEGELTSRVLDVISALYYFRTLDLEAGKEYVFDAHSGNESWKLRASVTGKETVKTNAGVFECFVIEPQIKDGAGIFKASGSLKVWITDDEKRMPVKLQTQIPIGAIAAELVMFDGKVQDQSETEKASDKIKKVKNEDEFEWDF